MYSNTRVKRYRNSTAKQICKFILNAKKLMIANQIIQSDAIVRDKNYQETMLQI